MDDDRYYEEPAEESGSDTNGSGPDEYSYGGPIEYGSHKQAETPVEPQSYGQTGAQTGEDPYRQTNTQTYEDPYGSAGGQTYGQSGPQDYTDPYQNRPPEEPSGMAIASLVLGIVSIVLFCTYVNVITGIISIILGAIHLAKRRSRRGMAISGIVLSIISIALLVIIIVAVIASWSDPSSIYNNLDRFMDL